MFESVLSTKLHHGTNISIISNIGDEGYGHRFDIRGRGTMMRVDLTFILPLVHSAPDELGKLSIVGITSWENCGT